MEEKDFVESESTGSDEDVEEELSDVEESEAFMEGDSSDEIVLNFDNGKKLFVSENFLCYASPVFQAMFRQDFREKETREVALKEKSFEDFREFLLCLHPGFQKPVDSDNMLKIVSLANEYQVEPLLRECKQKIEEELLLEIQSAYNKNLSQQTRNYTEAMNCLKILKVADDNGLEDIISYAVTAIANFGYEVFTGSGSESQISTKVQIETCKPSDETIFKFSHAMVNGGKPLTTPVSHVLKHENLSVGIKPSIFGGLVTQSGKRPRHVLVASPVCFGAPVVPEAELRSECKTLFKSLSLDTKNRILLERIKKCDNNRFSLAGR